MGKSRKSNRAANQTPSPPPEPAASPVAMTAPVMPTSDATPPPPPPPAPAVPVEAPAEVTEVAAEVSVDTPQEVPATVLPISEPEPEPVAPVAAPAAAAAVAAVAARTISVSAVSESDASATMPEVPAEVLGAGGESPAPKPPMRVQFKEPAANDFVSAPRFSTDTTASTRGPTPARPDDAKKKEKNSHDGEGKAFAKKELRALLQTIKKAIVWFLTDDNPRIRIARLLLLCVLSLNIAHMITRVRGGKAIMA